MMYVSYSRIYYYITDILSSKGRVMYIGITRPIYDRPGIDVFNLIPILFLHYIPFI